MKYSMNDPRIKYTGRIDVSQPDKPIMYFVGSSFKIRFKGTGISISLVNHTLWGAANIGYIIDGRRGKLPLNMCDNDKEITCQLCADLEPDMEHSLTVFKMSAANYLFMLTGLDIENGELCDNDISYDLKMEFFGDSVTAGEVTEAVDFVGHCDPCSHGGIYDNVLYSYAWMTAEALNAEAHYIAQGGISVLNGTGYFHAPEFIGMEDVYDALPYFSEAMVTEETPKKWDFSKFTPDVAVFALGQNDKHNGIKDTDDIDINDPVTRENWKNAYKNIIRTLDKTYGGIKHVLTTTVLKHDKSWDDAIEEMTRELNAEGISAYHNLFSRNGAATDGHPRIPEQREMAEELTAFIKKIL